MKFVCLGYHDERKLEGMSDNERNAHVDECLAYCDTLRENSHILGGECLESARNAVVLRRNSGQVTVTDGPYAETKELLGGLLLLDADDLNHAIELMSKHPGLAAGPFEIRRAEDTTGMIRNSERRRASATNL
jgi:hypothetical protein